MRFEFYAAARVSAPEGHNVYRKHPKKPRSSCRSDIGKEYAVPLELGIAVHLASINMALLAELRTCT